MLSLSSRTLKDAGMTFAAVICNKYIIIIYLEEANGRIHWSNQVLYIPRDILVVPAVSFLLLFGWSSSYPTRLTLYVLNISEDA